MIRCGADATPAVVTSNLILFSRSAQVFIDPGSTHSFISLSFAVHANVPLESLDYHKSTSISTRGNVVVDKIYQGCVIQFGDKEMLMDLNSIEYSRFRYYISMDWLSSHHASIIYYKNKVTFRKQYEVEFKWHID